MRSLRNGCFFNPKKLKTMKNLVVFILAIIFVGLWSCEKDPKIEGHEENVLEAEQRSEIEELIPFSLPFPEGTIFSTDSNDLKFTLPSTHYIVGIDEEGNFHTSLKGGSGSVTCECTSGSGCDPIKNPEGMGCLMKEGCTECTQTRSSIDGVNKDLVDIAIMRSGVDFLITSFSQIDSHYLLPPQFFDYPKVKQILGYVDSLQAEVPEMDTELTFIKIADYVLPVEVKMGDDNVSIRGTESSSVSCDCNVEGDCPREKHWLGGAVWCNSDDCTKCTMTASIVDANDNVKLFKAVQGKITIE